jgi:hypothetical protein
LAPVPQAGVAQAVPPLDGSATASVRALVPAGDGPLEALAAVTGAPRSGPTQPEIITPVIPSTSTIAEGLMAIPVPVSSCSHLLDA